MTRTQVTVAHASIDALRSVIRGSDAFTPEFSAILDTHFSQFALPSDIADTRPRYPCLKCGTLHAGFRWGIAHGSGYCCKCGWPARGYHYIVDENGVERRIELVLQYNPDSVTESRKVAKKARV